MANMRRGMEIGLGLGLGALAVGLALAAGSALVAADWWLAPEPWIGLGLTLIALGLAVTGVFALALDISEPFGRLRFVAFLPALALAAMWAYYLIVGLATTGLGGPERDIRTIFYSAPETLALFIILTLLVASPVAIQRIARAPGLTGGASSRT
jgi:bacteriorhodopsin